MRRNYGEPLGPGSQTNQRAELKAVLKALQTIPITQNLLIETDSTYAIICVTEWYYKWEWKSWRKAKGEPLKKKELIKPSVRQLEQREAIGSATYFRWVKGHAAIQATKQLTSWLSQEQGTLHEGSTSHQTQLSAHVT